ncbi:MAG: DNA polymerase IV [Candidatus Daviesbacteria bacterium]|nr:DNA polymerase IV [Candidatus Daviesbacteria bacterium]
MNRIILHIDFNSYFATVEQQANPRLRGKPIGVTGGDRMERTVIGAASIEAKKFGVRTGMHLYEALRLCPQIILVQGDSDKYLACTTRFLNIMKDYSPVVEAFSIDEVFMELPSTVIPAKAGIYTNNLWIPDQLPSGGRVVRDDNLLSVIDIALEIKSRIRLEVGEWMSCSIGISYNKLMAKLAGSLQKPDGLVVIENEVQAMKVLDAIPLDEICGIGPRIKKRLNKMGIFSFKSLRRAPLNILLLEFKSYGQFLYNASRGINYDPLIPFYDKGEVKSIGHRHTIDHDTDDQVEIKQLLLKLTELVARRLRSKNLVGRTVSCWFRYGVSSSVIPAKAGIYTNSSWIPLARDTSDQVRDDKGNFTGGGMQMTIPYTCDGLEIFQTGWKIFHQIWNKEKIRMIGVSISNLKPQAPQNLTFLEDPLRQEKIIQALDKINDKFGEFVLQRGILLAKQGRSPSLDTEKIRRKPNSFLADRRFKLERQ